MNGESGSMRQEMFVPPRVGRDAPRATRIGQTCWHAAKLNRHGKSKSSFPSLASVRRARSDAPYFSRPGASALMPEDIRFYRRNNCPSRPLGSYLATLGWMLQSRWD